MKRSTLNLRNFVRTVDLDRGIGPGRPKGWRKPNAMREAIMIRLDASLFRFVERERGPLSRSGFVRAVLRREARARLERQKARKKKNT